MVEAPEVLQHPGQRRTQGDKGRQQQAALPEPGRKDDAHCPENVLGQGKQQQQAKGRPSRPAEPGALLLTMAAALVLAALAPFAAGAALRAGQS